MKLAFACLLLFAGAVYWMLFGSTEVHDTELAHFALDELPASVEANHEVDVARVEGEGGRSTGTRTGTSASASRTHAPDLTAARAR
jgi:hypothetical protein